MARATSGGHLRFKAWKKNYPFYWSMGAEIETWGGNFISATIESIYIDTFLAQTCFVVKRGSDLTHILIEAGGK
jgi:hypothetical protein